MSVVVDPIPWSGVTDDGFVRAEIPAPPFDTIDIPEIKMSFHYTGDETGLIRLYRDLKQDKPETWILYTRPDGELSAEDDALWHVGGIRS